MPRVLLLLPTATYRAEDFVAAASSLDVEVVVGSEHRQAMADSMGDRALVLNFDDVVAGTRRIRELHDRSPLDAIVAVDDQGVILAAAASASLGLAHNPVEAARATRDKGLLRAALAAAGVPQPAYRLVPNGADVVALAGELGFPCVLKPLSLSASRGVIRVDDAAGAMRGVERVRALLADAGSPPDQDLLLERYVHGAEVAVEGLLRQGRLEVLAIFDKPDPLVGPYFEETIYVTPSRLREVDQATVTELVGAGAVAIDLREGPVHAEVRVAPHGEAWLIDVAGRSIGGLCSRALRFSHGLSLEDLILRHAVGMEVETGREEEAAGVMMIPISRSGVLSAVESLDEARAVPGIEAVQVTAVIGRPVLALPEGDRYLGFAFARGDSPAEVELALRLAHASLRVVIEPF